MNLFKTLAMVGMLGVGMVYGESSTQETKVLKTNFFTAYVLPVGREDRIVIRRLEPRDIAELSLLSNDENSGRFVQDIQWSSDRRFLVFSTGSVGGHSPWHHRTYVFSTKHWKFVCLDDSIAPVVSEKISFRDSSHIIVNVIKDADSGSDDPKQKTVDLNSLGWKKVIYPEGDEMRKMLNDNNRPSPSPQ